MPIAVRRWWINRVNREEREKQKPAPGSAPVPEWVKKNNQRQLDKQIR